MTAARSAHWNVIIAASLLLAAPSASHAQWTQWGGPQRNFKVDGVSLADSWPKEGPKVKWSRDLGPGHSAILVDDNVVYAMYHTSDPEPPAPMGPQMDDGTPKKLTDNGGRDFVIAMDARDGRTRWQYDYESLARPDQILDFGKGPNATPILIGKHLYAISFIGRLIQIDRQTGRPGFVKDLVAEFGAKMPEFGFSAAPLASGRNLIVPVGGTDAGLVAIDTTNGNIVWKSPAMDISYAAPILITVDGDDQIVLLTPTQAVGLSAKDGAIRWRYDLADEKMLNCSLPVWDAGRNLLYISSNGDEGGRVLKIGRVGDKWEARQLWADKKMRLIHTHGILMGDTIYGCFGVEPASYVAAVNLLTGNITWKERGFTQSNFLYADGKIIILNDDGRLALARFTPEKCEILSTAQLLESPAWAAPTLVKDTLYIRDQKKIMALAVGR